MLGRFNWDWHKFRGGLMEFEGAFEKDEGMES
jgi:hypothetical protein